MKNFLRTPARLLLALAGLLLGRAAQAQVDTYQFAASSGTFTPLTGGTPLAILGDDLIGTATIPFSFSFDSTPYTTVKISSNGYVSFNPLATTSSYNNALAGGSIATDKPLLAAFWDDLNGTGGSASYATTGTAPNRVFTVEWLNFIRYNTTGGPQLSFQVKLYETTNVVQYVYRQEANAFSSVNGASIGIASAVVNNSATFLSLNNTSATPSASSTVETDNIMTVPATGQTYTFTPRTPLLCVTPRNLMATNITATSAQLNWTVTGGTGPYTIVYGPTGFNPATGGTTITSATTNVTITGLTASTGYQFYVTQNCGGANGNSYQSNASSFQSACLTPLYATLPFSENFEGAWISRCDNRDVPSNNWRNSPATGNTSWRREDDATTANWTNPTQGTFPVAGAQGLHTARFHDYGAVNGSTGTFDLFIDLSGAGSRVLQFDYLNTAGADSLLIQVSTNGGVTFGPVLLGLNVQSSFARKSVSLPAGGTATSVIRFRARAAGFTSDLGLDNVSIANLTSPPDCVLGTTPANAATGVQRPVTITWTPGGNIPTSYEVYFGTTATPPLVTTTTANSYTPTGNLAGNTTYYYKIVPRNGLGAATGCATFSFTTGAVILYCSGNLGGGCGGNDITDINLQNTALNLTGLTCTSAGTQAYTSYPPTGANTATLLQGTSYPLSVITTGNSILSVWIDYNQNGAFEASEHTQVATTTTAGTAAVVNINVPLSAALGLTGMRIRSRASGSPNGPGDACTQFFSGETKDFLVTIGPASACPQPTALTATAVTTTTATLNFTAPGPGIYTLYYGPVGFVVGGPNSTALVNPTVPLVLTGLTPGTGYQFYVQRDCGAVGLSQRSGPTTFTTTIVNDDPCGAVTLALNATCTPLPATTVGATITAPSGYTNPGTGCAGFNFAPRDVWFKFTTAASGPASTAVRISVTGGSASTLQGFSAASCMGPFTPLLCSGAANNVPAPGLDLGAATPLTPNTTYYVRVMGFTGAATLGNFTICATAVPNCPAPSGLNATNLTNNTADLSWVSAPATGSTFTVLYGPQGFNPFTGGTSVANITGTTYTLAGLQPDTDYCYYLRQNCAGFNGNSSQTGPYCFRTPLLPPTNDEPCAATPLLAGVTLNASNIGGTTSTQFGINLPACSPAQSPKDVWFVFNPTASDVTFTMLGAASGMLRVFESPNCGAGPFNQVFCQAANGGFPVPITVTGLVSGRNYYATISGYGSGTASGNFTLSATNLGTILAGRAQANTGGLLVYPNPSNTGQLTLRLSQPAGAGQATLLNALGQEVLRQALPAGPEHMLHTRGLATGLYILRVQVGGQVLTRQVVLE